MEARTLDLLDKDFKATFLNMLKELTKYKRKLSKQCMQKMRLSIKNKFKKYKFYSRKCNNRNVRFIHGLQWQIKADRTQNL